MCQDLSLSDVCPQWDHGVQQAAAPCPHPDKSGHGHGLTRWLGLARQHAQEPSRIAYAPYAYGDQLDIEPTAFTDFKGERRYPGTRCFNAQNAIVDIHTLLGLHNIA